MSPRLVSCYETVAKFIEAKHIQKYFCLRMDAALGMSALKAAVLDRAVGSYDSCPVVIRLVHDGLFHLNIHAMFLDSVFDPVLNAFVCS